MIRPRVLVETDEISLYSLLGLAMKEGLDLREVFVGYAGCGSHEVTVWSMEQDATGPLESDPPRKLVPVDDGYDGEVGF